MSAIPGDHVQNAPESSSECESWRTYSRVEELVDNLPYIGMGLLGAAVLVVSLQAGLWAWIIGGVYVLYSAAGAFWIIVFMCPYCRFWNTVSCPCGYGRIAGRLREQKDPDLFKEKFRKHIPVIVPLWFIPPVVAVIGLALGFSWGLVFLLALFALDAFLVLPLVSRRHGCTDCPQKQSCPWMESETQSGRSESFAKG